MMKLSICVLLLVSVVTASVHGNVLKEAKVTPTSLAGELTSTPCSTICPMIWFPVCGSDGKTYGNTCEMKVNACLSRQTITLAKQGSC
ncbi:hypothetical protein V1264_022521 [Littorina saxatilis]|uniref:Kazal-like domain-containing protein n=1 Tax=Littorina saxatilis TaxID=31220 RepID=A0AAN9AKH0_9CAEN